MLILQILFGLSFLFSGSTPQHDGYLVQFENENSAEVFIQEMREKEYSCSMEPIFPARHIYHLTGLIARQHLDWPEFLSNSRSVVTWQNNHRVELRSAPNDPLYLEQWAHQNIGSETAWDYATGGTTSTGDEIVVAVLDAGFSSTHPDLVNNYWSNAAEIPDDEIDNDLNGYVDDYNGLNLKTKTDDHDYHIHGTSVSGIIAAEGDNSLGVSGINWQLRIMLVSEISTEANIIEGYNYILEHRRRYNDSNGTAGAFVVATNLSAGIDGAMQEDHPLWCAVYNALGEEGILSITAATNGETNVDVEGDIPTVCQSNYLITVTSSNMNNNRIKPSAYGQLNVDLGAPADPILTPAGTNGYEIFTGNSAAAPHVAGAVALLYATPCEQLMTLVKQDPAAGALSVKSSILSNVAKYPDFTSTTVSGGRLDLGASMKDITSICVSEGQALRILRIGPNPVRRVLQVTYQTPDIGEYTFYIHDMAGRKILERTINGTIVEENIETFDMRSLAFGVYTLTLADGKSLKETIQFVVQ